MVRPSKYPDQFRREAVQMALATDVSLAAVARRLGLNETTLRNWVQAHVAEEARGAFELVGYVTVPDAAGALCSFAWHRGRRHWWPPAPDPPAASRGFNWPVP
jgi:transposase-like protein